ESSFPGRSAQPKGRFKVGMPQSLARHCIIPRLPAFLRQYPELELLLCSSDNVDSLERHHAVGYLNHRTGR
ncbi:LysR family transcriptional regulator, partial [Klebsiella aerogenes]